MFSWLRNFFMPRPFKIIPPGKFTLGGHNRTPTIPANKNEEEEELKKKQSNSKVFPVPVVSEKKEPPARPGATIPAAAVKAAQMAALKHAVANPEREPKKPEAVKAPAPPQKPIQPATEQTIFREEKVLRPMKYPKSKGIRISPKMPRLR